MVDVNDPKWSVLCAHCGHEFKWHHGYYSREVAHRCQQCPRGTLCTFEAREP